MSFQQGSSISVKVNELLKSENPLVWVLNTSHTSREGKRGNVLITVFWDNQSHNISVPNTWIPINLAEQAPAEYLLRSKTFIDQLRNGILTLISDNEAKEIFNDPEAERESERIYSLQQQPRLYSKLSYREENNDESEVIQSKESIEQSKNNKARLVNPKILEILNRDGVKPSEISAVLRTNSYLFNKQDFEYVIQNVEDEKIRQWATKEFKNIS